MATGRTVLTNAYVKVGGTDFSDMIASIEFNDEAEEVETTAFGNTGRTRVGGLRDQSVSLDFHVDFDPAEVDATIGALVGGTAAIEFAPKGTAIGTANPRWSGTILVTEWGWGGGVGELATKSVTWPVVGVLTRSTTP
jgi:hypothetical protein